MATRAADLPVDRGERGVAIEGSLVDIVVAVDAGTLHANELSHTIHHGMASRAGDGFVAAVKGKCAPSVQCGVEGRGQERSARVASEAVVACGGINKLTSVRVLVTGFAGILSATWKGDRPARRIVGCGRWINARGRVTFGASLLVVRCSEYKSRAGVQDGSHAGVGVAPRLGRRFVADRAVVSEGSTNAMRGLHELLVVRRAVAHDATRVLCVRFDGLLSSAGAVTLRALHRRVRTLKRKPLVVGVGRDVPCQHTVTRRAVGAELRHGVRRFGRAVVLVLMAGCTVEAKPRVLLRRRVAFLALEMRVTIDERESLGVRVERSVLEGLLLAMAVRALWTELTLVHIVVACGALLRKSKEAWLSFDKCAVARIDVATSALKFYVATSQLDAAGVGMVVQLRCADSRAMKRGKRDQRKRVTDVFVVTLGAIARELRSQRAVNARVIRELPPNRFVTLVARDRHRASCGEVRALMAGRATIVARKQRDSSV